MRLSVVTVCYNAEKTIADTIKSVLSQSYRDFEYVIVDGKSSDRTYDIVCEFEDEFTEKEIPFRHISEKDAGIFDAMNKAVKIAVGEWVCFINADDQLYDSDVLKSVFSEKLSEYDVIYGNVFRSGSAMSYIDKATPIEYITLTMPFCHQSSFTRRELVEFDTEYLVADYKLFLKLYLDGKKFKQLDRTIARYSVEGFSNQNKYKTYLDVVRVKDEFGLVSQKSFKQKLKNQYHRIIIDENAIGHSFLARINKWITEKRKNGTKKQ